MKKHPTSFIAESASVTGEVIIGKKSSIWHNSTIRADSKIQIGEKTNIQDNCVLHSQGEEKTKIGDEVTVGHSAVVHGASVNDQCLIGINSTVLTNSKIGKNTIIGAGAVVLEEKTIPPKSIVMGVPGEVVRKITEKEIEKIKERAKEYSKLAKAYKNKK